MCNSKASLKYLFVIVVSFFVISSCQNEKVFKDYISLSEYAMTCIATQDSLGLYGCFDSVALKTEPELKSVLREMLNQEKIQILDIQPSMNLVQDGIVNNYVEYNGEIMNYGFLYSLDSLEEYRLHIAFIENLTRECETNTFSDYLPEDDLKFPKIAWQSDSKGTTLQAVKVYVKSELSHDIEEVKFRLTIRVENGNGEFDVEPDFNQTIEYNQTIHSGDLEVIDVSLPSGYFIGKQITSESFNYYVELLSVLPRSESLMRPCKEIEEMYKRVKKSNM